MPSIQPVQSDSFVRTGPLMDLGSYPAWVQQMVVDCAPVRQRVVNHAVFTSMRDLRLSERAARNCLVGLWPVVEQFPQFMAMNLLKLRYAQGPAHELARRYLIRNIRVEQHHADNWIDWADAHGVPREELLHGETPPASQALSYWLWNTCDRDSLAVAMAATNYAIEGVTGEWAALVCAKDDYENSFPTDVRKKATRWLRLHAHYDDMHPWEALEIICGLVGHRPAPGVVESLTNAVSASYHYLALALDSCLADETMPPNVIAMMPRPAYLSQSRV